MEAQDNITTITGDFIIKDKNDKVILDKNDITSAQVYFDKYHNMFNIMINTNAQGTLKVNNFTKAMIGQHLYVYLENKLISSLIIMAQINTSSFVIGGSFSKDEVDKLCIKINGC